MRLLDHKWIDVDSTVLSGTSSDDFPRVATNALSDSLTIGFRIEYSHTVTLT